jgi:predicted RNA-binding Zn-ribbon protein involved in translation (DUF1610 family)
VTTHKITLLRAALPLKCPACGTTVPWRRAAVDTAFLCPSCGRSIEVRRSYFRVFSLLSLPIAGLVAYALGARRDALVWGTLLGAFPVQFVLAFLTMRLFPPEAETTADYRSILHPVDPAALEHAARDEESRADGDGELRLVRTQLEAKRFFVERVIQRARAERVPLSDAERQMLSWSESDPDFIADPRLVEQLASELPDDAYEEKIAGLLNRGFVEDAAVDPRATAAWRHARSVLGQGDHYIVFMIDRAVGSRFKRWRNSGDKGLRRLR